MRKRIILSKTLPRNRIISSTDNARILCTWTKTFATDCIQTRVSSSSRRLAEGRMEGGGESRRIECIFGNKYNLNELAVNWKWAIQGYLTRGWSPLAFPSLLLTFTPILLFPLPSLPAPCTHILLVSIHPTAHPDLNDIFEGKFRRNRGKHS